MNPVLKQFDLSGKTALITGSSAGIGLALAQGLAGAGAAVVLNARNAAKLQRAAEAAARAGRDACMRWPSTSPTAQAVADAVARIEARDRRRSTSWSTTPACRSARRCRTSSRPTGTS